MSATGRVRAVGTGTATLTVSSEGKSATVQVRVGTWTVRALVAVGDRYELSVNGWMITDGLVFVQVAFGRQGTYQYDMFDGDLLLGNPAGPVVRGRHRADGRIEVTWRAEPGAPEATYVFSAR